MSHRHIALLLPLLLLACTPPLTTLKSSGSATVEVHIQGYHVSDPQTQRALEESVRAALAEELGPSVRVVEAQAGIELPSIRVTLLWPEPAEVPSYLTSLKRTPGEYLNNVTEQIVTLGLAPQNLEEQMALIGVDRDVFRSYQAEVDGHAIFEWGPFEKTAKRARLKQLGFTPLLFSGRYRIVERGGRRGLGEGIFLGWESFKQMDPISSTKEPLTEAQVLQASARGLAKFLRKRWS